MPEVKSVEQSSSNESCVAATGQSYETWIAILDAFDVKKNGHTKAANFLYKEHGVPYWWCQQITIAYEQRRGLRQPGQRSDGKFTVNVSKTIQTSAERAWEAWTTAAGWNAWFTSEANLDCREGGAYSNADKDQGIFKKIRSIGTPNPYGEVARLDFTWENAEHCPGSKVTVQFLEKGQNRVQVAITHTDLPGPDGCSDMKEGWSWALASLKSYLETGEKLKYEDWKAAQKR